MSEENAKKNIGCYFTIKSRRCQVLKVDKFGGILHYGFQTIDAGNSNFSGWIPVDFVGQCEW